MELHSSLKHWTSSTTQSFVSAQLLARNSIQNQNKPIILRTTCNLGLCCQLFGLPVLCQACHQVFVVLRKGCAVQDTFPVQCSGTQTERRHWSDTLARYNGSTVGKQAPMASQRWKARHDVPGTRAGTVSRDNVLENWSGTVPRPFVCFFLHLIAAYFDVGDTDRCRFHPQVHQLPYLVRIKIDSFMLICGTRKNGTEEHGNRKILSG